MIHPLSILRELAVFCFLVSSTLSEMAIEATEARNFGVAGRRLERAAWWIRLGKALRARGK